MSSCLILVLEADPNVTELAGTAGLLLVTGREPLPALDLLAISNASGLKLGLDAEAALELCAQNVNLNVACAGDDHLMGPCVVDEGKGRRLLR